MKKHSDESPDEVKTPEMEGVEATRDKLETTFTPKESDVIESIKNANKNAVYFFNKPFEYTWMSDEAFEIALVESIKNNFHIALAFIQHPKYFDRLSSDKIQEIKDFAENRIVELVGTHSYDSNYFMGTPLEFSAMSRKNFGAAVIKCLESNEHVTEIFFENIEFFSHMPQEYFDPAVIIAVQADVNDSTWYLIENFENFSCMSDDAFNTAIIETVNIDEQHVISFIDEFKRHSRKQNSIYEKMKNVGINIVKDYFIVSLTKNDYSSVLDLHNGFNHIIDFSDVILEHFPYGKDEAYAYLSNHSSEMPEWRKWFDIQDENNITDKILNRLRLLIPPLCNYTLRRMTLEEFGLDADQDFTPELLNQEQLERLPQIMKINERIISDRLQAIISEPVQMAYRKKNESEGGEMDFLTGTDN